MVLQILLRENSRFAQDSFSLIKINEGGRTEEIIAYGSADQIHFARFETER